MPLVRAMGWRADAVTGPHLGRLQASEWETPVDAAARRRDATRAYVGSCDGLDESIRR
jgi:hypothetical protein